MEIFGYSIYWYANGFIKSIARYGLPAMGVGALGAYIIGKNPNEGAKWCGMVVAGADACQYGVRSVIIPIAKDTHEGIKRICRDIKNYPKNPVNDLFN